MEDKNSSCKVVITGDVGVGKTHLLYHYIGEKKEIKNKATIGIEFMTKKITLKNGENMKAQMWDRTCKERQRIMNDFFYQNAMGGLLIYDVTKENSLENLIDWVKEFKENSEPKAVIMLVGNKIDIPDSDPSVTVVSNEKLRQYAEENNFLFGEVSAKLGLNVTEVFDELFEKIYDIKRKEIIHRR